MSGTIRINSESRVAGTSCAPYLIAEIGTNHNRDLDIAKKLVIAVADAGFDCAKFQIYEPEEIVSPTVLAKDYGLDKFYGDISADDMFRNFLQTPKSWFPELNDLCRSLGIDCATTIHSLQGLKNIIQ